MAHNNNNAIPAAPPPEWDLLLSAAQKNRPDLIRSMVTQDGVDPSHANGVGQSALHVAALWGHVEAVECLLQVGANVQARNSLTGATPLHMVITSHKGTLANKLQVVDLLLQHGGRGIHNNNLATMTDQYGRLPIDYLTSSMTTTQNENSNNGSVSVEAYVAAITEKLQPVDPPLFVAIGSVDVQKVQELVAGTAAANNNDDNGTTTLQQEELVNMTFRNETPVSKTVQLLISSAAETTVAASAQATEDSSSSSSNSIKMRLLVEILNLILQAGGNPNMPESIAASSSPTLGETVDPPLVQVLQALVEAYRDQQQHHEQEKEEANTTSATALGTGTSSIAALQQAAVALRKAGGVLTANQVAEFLHASARGSAGGLPMVQFLIQDLNLDPNATNRQGMTPLQFAARSGRVEIVQYLLMLNDNNTGAAATVASYSVNVHHQDNAGQTALDAARKNNKEQVVQILEEYIQAHGGGEGDQKDVAQPSAKS